MNSKLRQVTLETDFCIVGGGMAGLLAAISAARHGAKVVLMQDRPVLGGNASSEVRMWIRGAHGGLNRETGILEEIELENLYRNPTLNFSVWDSILYEKAMQEENITLLMNCSCMDAQTEQGKVVSVTGWQLTTYTFYTVKAGLFADCSGDSILAPLTGALYRVGREAADEFDESIEPVTADKKTMGMSCLMQARQTDKKSEFIPPAWAYRYETDQDLPQRDHDMYHCGTNFWWIELGGEDDSIHDTEKVKDELLKIAFGVWDHIKNRGDHGADNWELEWVGFLPRKRESRRYVGDYTLSQKDVESGGKFADIAAYGGWSMDDHNPAGFRHEGEPTIYHDAPSPYGIPYRCFYSKNIENLFFAGRNISVTHAALSSTRVMATCAIIGQAVGTAAAICVQKNIMPRGVYEAEMELLQSRLLEDGCYLPGLRRQIPELTRKAAAENEKTAVLFDGMERPDVHGEHCITLKKGACVEFALEEPAYVRELRLVFDLDFTRGRLFQNEQLRKFAMKCNTPLDMEQARLPETLVKAFSVEITDPYNRTEQLIAEDENRRYLVTVPVERTAAKVKVTLSDTWGCDEIRLYSCDLK